ncbi:MAG: hypothetical protein KDM81_03325 [Verrucomicrobiae bacterium]|nr:hypothetical protein [Verrucomicrobiae bacterium]
MTAIAVELDRKLQSLDPETAASVEQLVRDALRLAEKKPAAACDSGRKGAHRAHLARFVGIWADDDFERPSQGEFENREEW